jgi:hypothetical protein
VGLAALRAPVCSALRAFPPTPAHHSFAALQAPKDVYLSIPLRTYTETTGQILISNYIKN